MDEFLIEQLKKKLEEEKTTIESELSDFAKKDPKIKGNWQSRFPDFGEGSGDEKLEEEDDEVEEYATRLSIEHKLELKLRDINIALEKMKTGDYGKCEKCGERISKERLKAYPEARLCSKCEKEESKKNAI